MSEWISVEDELPKVGKPVLLKWNDAVQLLVYTRDEGDDGDFFRDWYDTHDPMSMPEAFRGDCKWMKLPE